MTYGGVVVSLETPFTKGPVVSRGHVHPVGTQFIIVFSFQLNMNYVFKEVNEAFNFELER